jgi:hypothetical protein
MDIISRALLRLKLISKHTDDALALFLRQSGGHLGQGLDGVSLALKAAVGHHVQQWLQGIYAKACHLTYGLAGDFAIGQVA